MLWLLFPSQIWSSDRINVEDIFRSSCSENKQNIQTQVILIDDVLTTCGTLRLCRNILEEERRTVLDAAVLALA